MRQTPCALVVMGVSGSGKSTIAESLAARLGWRLRGRRQVSPGQQCRQDERRAIRSPTRTAGPGCRRLPTRSTGSAAAGERAVIACSALKRAYRDILVHGRDDVRIVFLDGTQDLIADRLAARKGHFMPPGLLASQFRTLEPPGANERPITVSIDAPVEQSSMTSSVN